MKTPIYIAAIIMCAATLTAGETNALSKTGWREDFNAFMGTHATLPKGVNVSKDGLAAMPPDDSDFRGVHSGGVTTGGCYAWKLAENDHAIGYQPTTDEFTPGFFEVSFSNSSSIAYRFLNVEYDVVCLNNGSRSSTLQLKLLSSNGGATAGPVSETVQAEDSPAVWKKIRVKCFFTIPGAIMPGESFKLIWEGDDSSGSGSRDEYGIDNLHVYGTRTRGTVITLR